MVKLLICDLDGTLAQFPDGEMYPAVIRWFEKHANEYEKFAIASNQGGVGLGYWMSKQGFGKPSQYPTQENVYSRIKKVTYPLHDKVNFSVYAAFAYQSKKGEWSPTPDWAQQSAEWSAGWRKPNPGMLVTACRDTDCHVADALFVGDWDEDEQAAKALGMPFVRAKDLFGEGYNIY